MACGSWCSFHRDGLDRGPSIMALASASRFAGGAHRAHSLFLRLLLPSDRAGVAPSAPCEETRGTLVRRPMRARPAGCVRSASGAATPAVLFIAAGNAQASAPTGGPASSYATQEDHTGKDVNALKSLIRLHHQRGGHHPKNHSAWDCTTLDTELVPTHHCAVGILNSSVVGYAVTCVRSPDPNYGVLSFAGIAAGTRRNRRLCFSSAFRPRSPRRWGCHGNMTTAMKAAGCVGPSPTVRRATSTRSDRWALVPDGGVRGTRGHGHPCGECARASRGWTCWEIIHMDENGAVKFRAYSPRC